MSLPPKKIAIVGRGVVGRAFEKMVRSRYETVTYDPVENGDYPQAEIDACDLGVVCVPTNAREDGSCDTSIVADAVFKLNNPLILIKSTIEPGTTDRLVRQTGKRICFSPEYIGESKYFQPYWEDMIHTPFFIVGGAELDCIDIIALIEPITGPTKVYYSCRAVEAEIIKYMENSFFATKVTFVNEFYNICERLGANWQKVREGWLLDPRINKMHTSVFKDERGFGGKCYPKDLNAIIKKAESLGYSPELLKEVVASNKRIRESQT